MVIPAADYAILSVGLATMALGDLGLTKFGRGSWIHLDEDQRAIFGKDRDMLQPQDFAVSLQIWSPIIGILVSCLLFRSTVDTVIALKISDLVVALLYSGSFVILFYAPGALLHRAGVEVAKRSAAARHLESGRSSSEDSRRWAEGIWRSVIAAGFLVTGVSLSSLVGLPAFFGIPFSLIMLKKRLDYRTEHLERSRLAKRVAIRLREGS